MGRLSGFKYREVARKLKTFGFAIERPVPMTDGSTRWFSV